MASIPDSDKNVFSNSERSISDRFTEDEVRRIHEMALELSEILNAVINREDSWPL